MSSNSEVISRTIKDYFGIEKSDVTRDQLQQVKEFLKSQNSAALIIEKNDQSPNEVSFITRNLSESDNNHKRHKPYQSDTLVFVKYIQNADQKSGNNKESVINETQLISRLRNRLHQCDGSSANVMHALSDFRHATKSPQVLNALKSERKDLLDKVVNWSENCGEIEDANNRDVIERIGILKAREGKVKAVVRVSDQLFSDLSNYQSSKNTLEQVHKELADESQKLFREWHQSQKGVKLDNEKQCIEIDVSTQVPRVTFDPRLVKLAQDARILRCLGFNLPPEIVSLEDDVKKYGMYARELREIVNFYCSVADQILLSQRPMLIEAAKAFTSLLESRDRISWDGDPTKLSSWIDQLKNFARSFSTENRSLRRHHQKVLILIKPLFDMTPSKWRSNINEVLAIMQEIDYRYQNTLPWKKHWDHQLYKILEYHFNDALIKLNQFASNATNNLFAITNSSASIATDSYKIDLCFAAGNVAFKPPIEEIKAKIYARIKKFLIMVTQFQGFAPLPSSGQNNNNNSNENLSLFYAIYLRNFNNFPILYEKAEEMIAELEHVKDKFIEWTSLYYLIKGQNNSDLSHFLGCDTLDDYKNNLMLIKSKSQKFNKDFVENEIACESGNFIINVIPIKTFIDWLLIEIDKLLAKSLKEKCGNEMKEIDEKCSELLQKLGKRPQNISELRIIDQLFRHEISGITTELSTKFTDLQSKVTFLMKWSAKIAPDISELTAKYDEFVRVGETRDSLLHSYQDILKSKTQAEIGNANEEIASFTKRWENLSRDMKESKEIISEMRIECDLLSTKCEELSQCCDYFTIDRPTFFEKFTSIVEEVRDTDAKWNLIHQFESGISHYLDMEWIVSRNKLNAIESYITKWEEENPNVGPMLESKVKEWRELLSILKLCRGECFAKSHWHEFLSMASLNSLVSGYESLKLSHLIDARRQLITAKDAIKELNMRAANEMSIRETFNELDVFAANTILTLYPHITSQGNEIKLIKDWRVVLNHVAESILTLQSVKNAEFFTSDFAERSTLWETRLSSLDSILSLLNSVQRKWIFLEPIYSKDDTGMFNEYSFSPTSKDYQDIMKSIATDPHLMRLLHITGLETRLRTIDQTLITCQKKLQTFMEQSRARFPRFYFLADDDLLLILAGKAQVSQSGLLKKLFNNAIVKLNFDGKFITNVESREGETVTLRQKVLVDTDRGAAGVETWLRSLETELKSSLRHLFFDALSENERNLKSTWEVPSQILSLIQWVTFTKKTEDAIRSHSLTDLKSEYGKQLSSLTGQDSNTENIVLDIKVKSLILDTIHFLSVIEELTNNDIRDVDDWIWQKQLRFYANKSRDNKLLIKMGNSTSEYSFEYLGCFGGAKLVHTPLTDKCYITLTQAMEMGLGGNPYGPAGTGKTESVKALGQHFGRQVLVFNCDEAIDVKAMTRILVGLIKCGAWGCFDEFNRLQLDVLSSLSYQIQAIQTALKTHSKTVQLPEYGEVDINSNSAIFITLNPAGKQYGGRNRLPDNLKSLFLPVAMTVPDNVIISRVLLLAEGFSLNMSTELGEKITTWFDLARDCMTHQKHYDWGLRAIKTCLESCGRGLKNDPNKDEIKVVVDTLRKQIKSKLIDEDDDQFEALVCDVFGKRAKSGSDTTKSALKDAIIKIIEEKQLIIDEVQITKIIEFDEQLKSRLGVIILGQSGAGKSTLWKVLKEARRICDNCITNVVIINPKAVTRSQLLGYVDDDTREWHDGVITFKSREVARDESNNQFWIIFDGDIDPDWVEALNSVLDDNKVLTLPSGERIDFDQKKCNLIFETTSLSFASPATISRLGVTCISGVKSNQMIIAAMKQINAQISQEQILQIVTSYDSQLRVSLSRTVLSHISFAIAEDGDAVKGLFRVQCKLDAKTQNQKTGSLIITPSVNNSVEFLRPYIQSEDHVLFIGAKGVGKNAIAEETLLKTGVVVRINCTPDTAPNEIITALRSRCALITNGTSKVMKSPTNSKIILYIKHLELLKADKWQSKSLLAFLTQIMSYNGMYDESTFEWIHLQKFQIVCTCSNIKHLNPRLISLMHIINVSLPPMEEIDAILNGRIAESSNWRSTFTAAFGKVIREITKYQSNQFDILRIGVEIIQSLNRYGNDVSGEVLRCEFWRSFHSQIESRSTLEGAITLSLGADHNKDNVIFASMSGSSKLVQLSAEQLSAQIRKLITSWVNETEVQDPKVALIPETISIFGEANSFLSEDSENDKKIKGLVLVGRSGCGRKLAIKVTCHAFGYDQIWSPKVSISDKHLAAELKALIYGEDDHSDKKILLLIDEMHLQIMPHLRDRIYGILNEYNGSSMIRIVLTLNSLHDVRQLMWSRVCHIHLINQWSSESLAKIPQMILKDEIKDDKFSQIFYKIHDLFPQFSDEPRKYIAFVHTFAEIMNKKKSDIEKRREHLKLGVAKLDEASHEMEKLKSEAEEQKELLAEKRQEADDALNLITSSMHASEDQKVELEDIKSRTEKETAKLKVRKREIDAELKEIEPTLMAAKAAVGGITSESLAEIRSLRAPPEVIRDILEGVLRLMGVNDTSWVSMKSFLSRRGVKDEIMNFDSRKITPDMREKVEVLLQNRGDSYDPVVAKRASVAAAPLAEWVKANVSFSKVLHKIKPLETEQNRLESGLRSAQSRMRSLSNQLEGVEVEVGVLRDRLNHVTVEAAQIEVGLKQTSQILAQSEKLIGDLSGEFSRWKDQLSEINAILESLPINSLVAAAYIIYCSSEASNERRNEMLQKCCQIVHVQEFDAVRFFDCSSEDDVFMTVKSNHLTPLICDPSKKVVSKFSNCEITDMRSRDWIKVFELSLRFGRTLIINDFSKLDMLLLPILSHEIYGAPDAARNWCYIGEKRVDYNTNFKLYFVTQDVDSENISNPLFNVINLSPTGSGMRTTLLSIIIQCRRPELETKINELEKTKQTLELSLRDLESQLLKKLTSSTGNLINDADLVRSLKDIKTSAMKVEQSLAESAKLSDDLNRERAEYESLATFASQIYFLIQELVTLNSMYRYGVSEYETVFAESLQSHKELTAGQMLQDMYNYVSRGLFPEDREIFKRFLQKQCPRESNAVTIDEGISLKEFIKSVYGSRQKVALIMTSPGCDPTSELQEIASEMNIKRFPILSMGADVITRAQQVISNNDDTEWICLTNLHLVISWMPNLSRLLQNISNKFVILVTECHDEFPVSLLELSIKFAYESSPGLQSQLKRLATDESVKSIPELRILSYFHAICCERRHYVPQGWTKSYEFGFNDFRAASTVIQTVVQSKDRRLRFDFIRGLLMSVIYGGKLDTHVDDNILKALIRRWFTTNNDNQEKGNLQDEISVMGLPSNVNKLRHVIVEERLMRGLRVLEKATNVSQIREEIKRLRSLWKDLAGNRFTNEKPHSAINRINPESSSPLKVYINSEYLHIQKLIQIIDKDLNTDDDNGHTHHSLLSNEVPDQWLTVWPNGPQYADQFIRCVLAMANEIRKMINSMSSDNTYDLSHFLYPTSLLNALRQQASRELRVSVDWVKMCSSWGTQTLKISRSMNVTINGIMIEGALFDGRQLQDCHPESPLQSVMPPLSLYFLPKDSPSPYDNDVISMPVYASSGRESVLTWMDVPCSSGSQSHWTQCATSLVIKYLA